MRSWFSRAVSAIRWAPLYVLAMASTYVFTTAQPASAASPINGCTTTNAFKSLFNVGINNVINPIKYFGWPVFFVVLVVAMVVGIFAAGRNAWWGKVIGIFCLMVIVIPLAAKFLNVHVGSAC